MADEPTSGLDAFAAGRVAEALSNLARGGRTVVASIHQPRSSVFALFDDLILLSEGRVVYAGPASDAVAYFEAAGFACPPRTNPAEFLADLVAVDHSSPDAEAASSARVAGLQAAWAAKDGTAGEGGAPACITRRATLVRLGPPPPAKAGGAAASLGSSDRKKKKKDREGRKDKKKRRREEKREA